MKITSEHVQMVEALVPTEPGPNLAPAGLSFLAAIERLEDESQGRVSPTALWMDTAGDHGEAYTFDGDITLRVHDSSPAGPTVASQILTPDDAERRGWELIALAYLARSGS